MQHDITIGEKRRKTTRKKIVFLKFFKKMTEEGVICQKMLGHYSLLISHHFISLSTGQGFLPKKPVGKAQYLILTNRRRSLFWLD